ncbi:MAG: hypothetical protein M3Y56_00230, partial [Armatimonadota bacterium]|nr:hypothetical protein [Armatimonadota bacterium]
MDAPCSNPNSICGSHREGTPPLERVQLSQDGRGFVLEKSGLSFHPWGVNYGNNGRLIEDYWINEWPTVQEDFLKIKALGYNVVRVHLQFGKFMDSARRP